MEAWRSTDTIGEEDCFDCLFFVHWDIKLIIFSSGVFRSLDENKWQVYLNGFAGPRYQTFNFQSLIDTTDLSLMVVQMGLKLTSLWETAKSLKLKQLDWKLHSADCFCVSLRCFKDVIILKAYTRVFGLAMAKLYQKHKACLDEETQSLLHRINKEASDWKRVFEKTMQIFFRCFLSKFVLRIRLWSIQQLSWSLAVGGDMWVDANLHGVCSYLRSKA